MDQLQDDVLRPHDIVMLIKVGKTAITAQNSTELYELARKWWKASPVQARRARRVLAVAGNQVIAAYEPIRWEVSTAAATAGKLAFHADDVVDGAAFVGLPVDHLFPKGAANPIRYTTLAALAPGTPSAGQGSDGPVLSAQDRDQDQDTILLLRINQSWRDDISAAELYEATRGFWVMSATKAEGVTRALAVANGVVREAYEPLAWSPSPVPGEEHRIGFDGQVADDRNRWVGLDVSPVFPHGSQNPVRYVVAADLDMTDAPSQAVRSNQVPSTDLVRGSEPDLAERIAPLLDAFDSDLMWTMSRAAQELFHSNTLSWLMSQHPVPSSPLRALFEGPDPSKSLEVWREWRHIDLVARCRDGRARYVVENKLYSIPYTEQLERYACVALPWSTGHGESGAPDTSYFLLTLMDPNFDLPAPWRRLSYEQVLRAMDLIDPQHFGQDADLFDRYRTLVRRLVELKETVDPRQDLDEPFSVTAALANLDHKNFAGPIQRMRFTGLAQTIIEEYGAQLSLGVELSNSAASLTYTRDLSQDRSVGWQFQAGQLRLFALVRDRGLAGKGDERAAARAKVAEAAYADFVDFSVVETVLGDLLQPKAFAPGVWQRFAPDFVYRYRKVDERTTTRMLAEALAELTAYVDAWDPVNL